MTKVFTSIQDRATVKINGKERNLVRKELYEPKLEKIIKNKSKILFEGNIYDNVTHCSRVTGIDKTKLNRCAQGLSTVLKVEII